MALRIATHESAAPRIIARRARIVTVHGRVRASRTFSGTVAQVSQDLQAWYFRLAASADMLEVEPG